MPLDLLNDVLLLDLALESPQGVLQRFTFLDTNFCQTRYTPKLAQLDSPSYPKLYALKSSNYVNICKIRSAISK